MLAHNASVLGVPFDSYRLFSTSESEYREWLGLVVEVVEASKAEAARKARNG